MKKMVGIVVVLAVIIATLIGVTLTGCTRREHNYAYASVEGFTPIEVREITVNPIKVETINTETITWENVRVENWD